jgi:integrase
MMPGKRGNSEGSIVKRADGRWMARITLEGGVRKTFYAKTRQEAARRLAAASRDRDTGVPIVGERQTVEQYFTTWLADIRPTIRPRSWVRYEEMVRLHVLPSLGGTVLSRLTAQQLQALYSAKLAAGFAPATVGRLHAVIRRALGEAARLGLTQRNVATLVRAPRPAGHEMHVLTPLQARTLLSSIVGDPLETLYVLALTTGMRRGELLALHWSEIDLEAGFLQVRWTLQHMAGGVFVLTPPKTARSRRKIALTSRAIKALHEQKARQQVLREAAKEAWNDEDFVFTTALGYPIRGNHILQRQFAPLLAKAGLPAIRFHDLRHTAATLLLLRGIHPKVVSEMLGHSTISMTLDIYSHVLPDMQRDAVDALNKLLGKGDFEEDEPETEE